jgi:hypothetical protein
VSTETFFQSHYLVELWFLTEFIEKSVAYYYAVKSTSYKNINFRSEIRGRF